MYYINISTTTLQITCNIYIKKPAAVTPRAQIHSRWITFNEDIIDEQSAIIPAQYDCASIADNFAYL